MTRQCSRCGDTIEGLSPYAAHCEDCLTEATLKSLGIDPTNPAATPNAVKSLVQ